MQVFKTYDGYEVPVPKNTIRGQILMGFLAAVRFPAYLTRSEVDAAGDMGIQMRRNLRGKNVQGAFIGRIVAAIWDCKNEIPRSFLQDLTGFVADDETDCRKPLNRS